MSKRSTRQALPRSEPDWGARMKALNWSDVDGVWSREEKKWTFPEYRRYPDTNNLRESDPTDVGLAKAVLRERRSEWYGRRKRRKKKAG